MIANGILTGAGGGSAISFGVTIILGSVVVGIGAMVGVEMINRRTRGKLGCLGFLGTIALFLLILLCLLATIIGILYAGCGIVTQGNR